MNPSKKSTILKDTLTYGSANYVVQGIGIVNSVVLRRFMGPTAMGIWSLLQVILGYCGYASFGTTKALMRDYPYLRGRGEHQKAESLKDLVFTFSMLGSIIPALVIVFYLIFKWTALEGAFRVGLLFITAFLFVQRFYDLLMALLRSDKKFTVLSQLIILNALAGLACTVFLVSHWNIYGLFAGTAIVTIGCLFFIEKASPYNFHYLWDTRALWRELRLGIPLVAMSFLAEFFRSLDKWIIANKLGFHELGLYSIAMMANSYVFSLPMMFAHVLYPSLQEEYGQKGTAASVKHYLTKAVFVLSIVSPFLCGLAVFLMPPLAHLFLPRFVSGLFAMKIYLVGTFFLLLAQFSVNFLVTLDKFWVTIPLLIAAIPVNYGLNLMFLRMHWGLEGVALGSAISFLFYGVGAYIMAMRHFASSRDIVSQVSNLVFTLTLFFGGLFLIDRLFILPNLYGSAFVRTIVFMVFSVPFFWVLEKKSGLLTHLGQIMFKRKAAG